MKKLNNENKHTLKIKIACLLFAFLMWVYVMSDLNPVDTRELKSLDVSIANMAQIQDANLTVSPNQELKADIKLKSRRSVMTKKIKEGIKLQTTIKNPKIGINESDIEVVGDKNDIAYAITPMKLSVKLEENKIRSEKINVKSIGTLAQNCIIDSMAVSKSNVYISGPESLIKKVYKVQAEVPLSNAAQDFTKRCKLKVIDKEGKEVSGIQLEIENVLISVKVKKEKILPIKANIVSSVAYNDEDFEIEPEKIKIYGNSVKLAELNSIETKPIKLETLLKEKEMQIDLVIPNGCDSSIRKVKIKSNINTVDIGDENNIFNYNSKEIEIENKDKLTKEQLESIVFPENIKLKFEDDKKDVKKEDIHLYINADEFSTGKLNIKFKSEKNDLKDVVITPSYIEVKEENKSDEVITETSPEQNNQN